MNKIQHNKIPYKTKYGLSVKLYFLAAFFLILMPEFLSYVPGYGLIMKLFYIISGYVLIRKAPRYRIKSKFNNLKPILFIFIFEVLSNFIFYLKANFQVAQIPNHLIYFTLPFLFSIIISLYITDMKSTRTVVLLLLIPIAFEVAMGLLQIVYGSNKIVLNIFPQIVTDDFLFQYETSRNIMGELSGSSSYAKHIIGTFGHFNRYAYFIFFGPIVMLAMGDSVYKKSHRIYYYLLAFLTMVCVYYSYSRGALLWIGIFLFFYLYKFKIQNLNKIIRYTLIVIIFLIVLFLIRNIYIIIQDYYYRTQNLTQRLDAWNLFLSMISQFNIETFLIGSHEYELNVGYFPISAHNSYLMILYDKGIVGLALYIYFFVKVALAKNPSKSMAVREIFLALKLTFFAFALTQFFDHKLFANPLHRLYIFAYGAIILTCGKFLVDNDSINNKMTDK